MIVVIATLIIGVIIGYLGQRSRFCLVSGIRDLFILKNTYRIKGLLGLLIGAVLGFIIFKLAGGDVSGFPEPKQIAPAGLFFVNVIGGAGIGFFSVLAEGCPFRQHVMAAEGRQSAMFYLLGFYLGIICFNVVTLKFLELFITITS